MPARPLSGHVLRVERAHGRSGTRSTAGLVREVPADRRAAGSEEHRPAWTRRVRPATGYFTKRLAEDWLRDLLHNARHGTLASHVPTGATFADAAAEWLRYIEHDRRRKPSNVAGYKVIVRSTLLPAFGHLQLEEVTTPMIERWIGSLDLSASTPTKAIVLLHGIFRRAKKLWGLSADPVTDVEKPPLSHGGDLDVSRPRRCTPSSVAAASEQDAAIFLTAAFTGLRRGAARAPVA